jgi:hypothetical protein
LADLVPKAAAVTVNALTRRHGLNLGLLGLAGGLAVLALIEPGRERATAIPPLLALTAERIERIAVERPGQAGLAFERREGRWWMTAPDSGLANPVLIHPIPQLAEVRCAPSYAVAGLDLSRLRLEPPRLRLWLNGQEIHFGDIAPTDGQRYLRVGATVHLCPDRWYPLLTSAAASFLAAPIEPSVLNAARRD